MSPALVAEHPMFKRIHDGLKPERLFMFRGGAAECALHVLPMNRGNTVDTLVPIRHGTLEGSLNEQKNLLLEAP